MADVMTKKFMDRYGRSGSCGDQLSETLSKFLTDKETGRTNSDRFNTVCEMNRIPPKKWKHLNAGQQRMLLGNVLRGKLKRGVAVVIGPVTVPGDVLTRG